ncbi:polyprenyl diphosphate synthase [Thioclava kandeliae]|uniref:Isoprenyl transferase n=1 Tax=Thioclava kandeliae TaxID=3070818 RepID=A0ABV1SEX0_9RHOB
MALNRRKQGKALSGSKPSDPVQEGDVDYGVRHIAIIMDGNGRWAKNRGWPRLAGHRRGAERIKEITKICPTLGVRYLTVYAFSTENWKRSTEEVLGLMAIFSRYIEKEADSLSALGVRMRFIGARGRLDGKLAKLMASIEERTKHNERLTMTVAINYGGRHELGRAAAQMARDFAAGLITEDELNAEAEAALEARLDTAGLPDPDLVIRTSGETRTSNFLPWQAAYAEYEFTKTLWPDFSPDELEDILARFGNRERRFGGVKT